MLGYGAVAKVVASFTIPLSSTCRREDSFFPPIDTHTFHSAHNSCEGGYRYHRSTLLRCREPFGIKDTSPRRLARITLGGTLRLTSHHSTQNLTLGTRGLVFRTDTLASHSVSLLPSHESIVVSCDKGGGSETFTEFWVADDGPGEKDEDYAQWFGRLMPGVDPEKGWSVTRSVSKNHCSFQKLANNISPIVRTGLTEATAGKEDREFLDTKKYLTLDHPRTHLVYQGSLFWVVAGLCSTNRCIRRRGLGSKLWTSSSTPLSQGPTAQALGS